MRGRRIVPPAPGFDPPGQTKFMSDQATQSTREKLPPEYRASFDLGRAGARIEQLRAALHQIIEAGKRDGAYMTAREALDADDQAAERSGK